MAKALPERDVDRFLGLSLGGAKSDRTCLAVIDYYRKQKKSFVIDVFESIGSEKGQELNGDQVLLELITELQPGIQVLACDAPLTLPPCLADCDVGCHGYDKCKKPEVRWMQQQYLKARSRSKRTKCFTPYSQRPVDLYFKYKYRNNEIAQDETLGANLAPQAARMQYLKRHLGDMQLIEVWPKLTLLHIQKSLKVTTREVGAYRNVERGLHIRNRILDRFVEKSSMFIYERDHKKIVSNIAAFDALLCAWAAMQFQLDSVVKFKSDLPLETGWVELPELE